MTDAIVPSDWKQVPSPHAREPLPLDALPVTVQPPKRRLRTTLIQAAGWSMMGYLLSQVVRIASNLVLTRLLIPEMFGIMAVATMIQVSVAMLSDLGLRPAAIQSQFGDDQSYLDTAWTLQIIHGCLIWFACVLIAIGIGRAAEYGLFPAGSVYTVASLPAIIMGMSFCTVIMGLQSTKLITAFRHLDLGRVTLIEIVAQVVSLAVGISLAWYTGSIWSFVAATLLSALTTTILTHIWLPGQHNSLYWEGAAIRDLVRFGRWIMLSSILTMIAANGDRIFLAGWTSPLMLGFYSLAFNLISMLEGAGGRLFLNVAMPALGRIARERPEQLGSMFWKMRLPLDLVFIGSAGAIYSSGTAIIEALYDDRYRDAAPIIQILSFSLLIMRFGPLSAVYLAVNEPRNQTVMNFIRAVSSFTCLPLGYYLFGFEGAVWAAALYGLPVLPAILYFNHRHGLNNFLYEAGVLLAWPVGYLAGSLATGILHHAGPLF
ncbi:oligosaccharide flippase family protein [Neorhizobium galegae]|uniref:oligosaccharide flippase family protein n=1 Tax=Neorhizobium galegae TaxID=399 RepID=UPI00062126B5|nr:oligosaccharide flippase family protein [Neorhizobium galegae]MCQ1806814.1 oligosaccharide flippase family protein [Neorhizobium galegae]CDZ56237.1 Lipopolysaccharide biosynthesis protein WzxC [Neorhizobium galegae bv. orientalis]CDZ70035.1 Lipopolysaccharide biosynthesis protein WzxC [Neorhizobium galegae bv. orientalis]